MTVRSFLIKRKAGNLIKLEYFHMKNRVAKYEQLK